MILLLAAVPDVPETAWNMSKVIYLVGTNDVAYKLIGDLRLLNICFGIQSCSALYPCVYCTSK